MASKVKLVLNATKLSKKIGKSSHKDKVPNRRSSAKESALPLIEIERSGLDGGSKSGH